MNKTVKTKWIEALRSGKYEQGMGTLCQSQGGKRLYCCLGVLCDISGLGEWKERANESHVYVIDEEAVWEFLPQSVAEWAELTTFPNGDVPVSELIRGSLAEINDDDDSFAQIADIIEKHL